MSASSATTTNFKATLVNMIADFNIVNVSCKRSPHATTATTTAFLQDNDAASTYKRSNETYLKLSCTGCTEIVLVFIVASLGVIFELLGYNI